MFVTGILSLVIAYLLGSIPFAFIVAELKKVDNRRVGTGNVGTMNVARELGLLPGIAVLVLDMAKGCLAIFIARWLGVSMLWVFLAGFAAVLGHSWSPFLKFKGGKGLAPALGVLLALTPLEFGIVFIPTLVIFYFTRNSGLAAGIGLIILPLVIWTSGKELSLILYPLIIGIFMGLRNLLDIKPALIKANINSFFRTYPAFWRKRKK